MKITVILTLTLFFTACTSTRPIRTTVDFTPSDNPSLPIGNLKYASEKDVLFSKRTVTPDGTVIEEIDFKALSSAPAYAQAEREQALVDALNKTLEVVQTRLSPTR